MPSSSGWSSLFHVGARTWRAKTDDESFLELERKKFAEEAERKEAEVKQKIELLDQVRKLEAKTQALNEMSRSAQIQTKEHELAMRERQMAESKQIELAKLELAKRMGEESLNEADFARIRRERMKAELLARQSNDHALRELERADDQAELDERMATMPQPPSFRSPDGLSMPMRGHPPMAGPIPMPGCMSTPRPIPIPNHMPMSGPMSMPSHMFMPGPMSMPGHMHMPPSGPHPAFDHHVGMPMGPQARFRGRSESLSAYPGDIGRGDWGPGSNMMPGQGLHLSDHLDHQRVYSSNRDFRDHNEPIAVQMALRAQAELMRRKRLENLDQKAMQHNWNAQALRELRKGELVARLRERGAQQRQIEAEVAQLAEQDRRMNEAQLREQRDREFRHMLKKKGLEEREITEQLKRREEKDREVLRNEVRKLDRAMRHQELMESERSIREANRNGKAPPMGIKQPSFDQIHREGLLDHMWDEFQELNPRLQHEILSMQAHYKPHHGSRRPSMGSLNQPHLSRAPTPQTREHILQQMAHQLHGDDSNRTNMRPGSKASSRDHDYGPTPLSRHSSIRQSSNSPGPSHLRSRPPSRCLGPDSSPLNALRHGFESGSSEQISRSDASLNDEALAARLQSAALNSELNGGRRSRASSRAGQMNDEHPMSRHRLEPEPSLLNPHVGRRSRASTIAEQMDADILRGGLHYVNSELGSGCRSRSNSTVQSFGSSPQSRMAHERPVNLGLGRSPGGSDRDVAREEADRSRNSRPPSRANMPGTSYNDNRYSNLTNEELGKIPAEELQMLLGGRDVDPSKIRNKSINFNHLRPEEINQMSAEQIDILLSQYPANHHANMGDPNVDTRQSHMTDGRPASISVGRTSSSSSPRRQSSMTRGPVGLSRSSSRCGTFSNHQSGLERRDSRNNSHHSTSPLNPSNGNSPSNYKSLYSMSGRHDMYGGQEDGGRTSSQDGCHHQAREDLDDDDFIITERPEHPGVRIVEQLGRVEASSRENYQPVESELADQNEMRMAVKNLIDEARRRGANGVVCLRVADSTNGSYVASGEAVILAQP